ncbi:MAG: hypothetical protein HKN49_00315 [Gammaproteobacteria bacterium]|nr:hypothetical protein [Gammaproteobacteria bacterium]
MNNLYSTITAAVLLLAGTVAQAQQFEVVHSVDFTSTSGARAALDMLFADDAMKDAKATLYAADLGDHESSHLIVVDFDNYQDYITRNKQRRESHGWSQYLLATQDSEYHGGDMFVVVDDHGKSRHTAGYLGAYLIKSSDAELYREAIADLNKALGNPGVLRLVQRRTGGSDMTHAVLIGGKDFAAVNEYLDKLQSSDAYKDFAEKVGDTREVLGFHTYRRVAHWSN